MSGCSQFPLNAASYPLLPQATQRVGHRGRQKQERSQMPKPKWDICVAEPAWLWDFPEVRNRKGTEGGPVHSGEKPVVHTQCNFSCTTACHLKIHNQIHSGEMYFNCRQCNCACTTAGNLKRHMLTHSRAKPFGCSQCNNTFTTAQNL